MAARRISSLLNLSSMGLGSNNNGSTIDNTRRSSDQSMSNTEAKRLPGRRNFSRPAGGSSQDGSFTGSNSSSRAQTGAAAANLHASQHQHQYQYQYQQHQQPQQNHQQHQQHQQQIQSPPSGYDGSTQSPPPINEQANGQQFGPASGRWGRLGRPSSRAAGRSDSPRPGRSIDAVNQSNPDVQGEDQGRRTGKSWLRSRSRSRSTSHLKSGPTAWIIGLEKKVGYNVSPMLNADKVRYNFTPSPHNSELKDFSRI